MATESKLIIRPDGSEEWHLNNQLHREDGPAIISKEFQAWYIHSQCHRDNNPAIIWNDGVEFWYQHNKSHRIDGPAVCGHSDKYMEWWIDGRAYTFRHYCKKLKLSKEDIVYLRLKYEC